MKKEYWRVAKSPIPYLLYMQSPEPLINVIQHDLYAREACVIHSSNVRA